MRKLKPVILSLILLQGCQVYRPIGLDKIKSGRNYKITHENGQVFDTKCEKVDDENIVVIINEKALNLPKSEIDKVEKQKISPIGLIAGLTVTTIAAIILINDADQETTTEQILNQ